MRDPFAVALALVWVFSGALALAGLWLLYRREVRACAAVKDLESERVPEFELDELVWGWPDRP